LAAIADPEIVVDEPRSFVEEQPMNPRRSNFGWIVVGAIFLIVGGYYVLANTFGLDISWDAVWPLVIVGLGVLFLLRAVLPSEAQEPHA
jgi:hypothetical protein